MSSVMRRGVAARRSRTGELSLFDSVLESGRYFSVNTCLNTLQGPWHPQFLSTSSLLVLINFDFFIPIFALRVSLGLKLLSIKINRES